jgi:hypothetical protein
MNNRKKERKKKLKNILNWDNEMNFVESFWNMKKTSNNDLLLDEFETECTKLFVDTDQINALIIIQFIEDETIRQKVIKNAYEIESLIHKKKNIETEIQILTNNNITLIQKLAEEDDDDYDFSNEFFEFDKTPVKTTAKRND